MSRRSGLALAAGVIAFAAVTTLVGIASGAPLDFLVLDLVTGLTFVVAGIAAVWLRPAFTGRPDAPRERRPLVRRQLRSERAAGRHQPRVRLRGLLRPGPGCAAARAFLTGPTGSTAMAGRGARRGDGRRGRSAGCSCSVVPTVRPNPFAIWPDLAAFEAVEIASSLAMAGALRARRVRGRCGDSFVPVPSGGASAGRSSSPAAWRWASPPSMPSSTLGRSPRSSPSSPCPSRGTRCSRGRCSRSGPSCRSPS